MSGVSEKNEEKMKNEGGTIKGRKEGIIGRKEERKRKKIV